jgi:hypothetical protein
VLNSGHGLDDLILSLQIDFSIDSRQIMGYLVFLLDVASSEVLEHKIATFIESME